MTVIVEVMVTIPTPVFVCPCVRNAQNNDVASLSLKVVTDMMTSESGLVFVKVLANTGLSSVVVIANGSSALGVDEKSATEIVALGPNVLNIVTGPEGSKVLEVASEASNKIVGFEPHELLDPNEIEPDEASVTAL